MKKTMLSLGVIVLSSITALAQTPVTPVTTTSPVATTSSWDAHKNPTVAAILNKYESVAPVVRPVQTTKDIFPVLGQFTQTGSTEIAALTISPDETNKGIIHITGLPQGEVKAMLRKSPATYIIPAQKTAEGNSIAEGTLMYEADANTLNICLGKSFNDSDPAAAFTTAVVEEKTVVVKTTKSKTKVKKPVAPKVLLYSFNKVLEVKETVSR